MAFNRTLGHFTSAQDLAPQWGPATSYQLNQFVTYLDRIYRALSSHTSAAAFATDLATGNWVLVNASSTLKNYIVNGLFDGGTVTSWSLAHSTIDATTKLPNQASSSWTAASANLSIQPVSSGQLAGQYSLGLASIAATIAGDMLVSDPTPLDLEAQSSIQTFSFFYKVFSGATNLNLSGTSANSIGVAIYDVTNGSWIDPAGRYNIVQSSGVGKCAGTFQVPSNCTSVRLAVYFPNASISAATVYLDDFFLGPQIVQQAPPVTDWAAYTPTFTGMGTVVAIDMQWRRVGDMIQLRGKFQTGTVTAVEARMTLPPGLTAAGTDKIPTIQVAGTMNWATATSTGVVLQEPNVAYATFGFQNSTSNPLNKINGTTLANNLVYSVVAAMPIAGYSSAVSMSNDTDTRVIATAVRSSATVSMTAGNAIIFQAVDFDRSSSYNSATGQFTVPVAGVYEMSVVGFLTVAGTSNIRPYKNGSPTQGGFIVAFNGGAPVSGSYLVDCKAGDILTFVSDATTTLSTNSVGFWRRLSGPAVIAASEPISARYAVAASVASSTTAPINFATKSFDSHSAVTTGAAWKFTAPISAKFRASVTGSTSAGTTSVDLYKNNSFAYTLTGVSSTATTSGSTTIDLLAGDFIDFRFGAALSTGSSGSAVYVCIEKIG